MLIKPTLFWLYLYKLGLQKVYLFFQKKVAKSELVVPINPPKIEDIKLELLEAVRHRYEVGYGQGDGAGFAGGTRRGKVRFIRLQYSGGDWDQDFGIYQSTVTTSTDNAHVQNRSQPISKDPTFQDMLIANATVAGYVAIR